MHNVSTNDLDQIDDALIDRLYKMASVPLLNEEFLKVGAHIPGVLL